MDRVDFGTFSKMLEELNQFIVHIKRTEVFLQIVYCNPKMHKRNIARFFL